MVINLSILRYSVKVHVGVKKNLHKRNHLCKDQPNINHLHIGRGGQALGHADEERGEDQERGQVHSNHCFKKEILEEICCIDNDKDENSWEIYCQDSVVYSSPQHNFDVNTILFFT